MALQSSSGAVANQQTLQSFNLQREDYGVYQCVVSRGTREVQATVQHFVFEKAIYYNKDIIYLQMLLHI